MSGLPDLAPGQAVLVDWPAERYHADRSTTSRGQLLDLIDRPARYHAVHEAHTLDREAQTKAMRTGTAVHAAALESADFIRRVFVAGKRGRDRLGRPRQPDAIDLTLDEYNMTVGLAASFHAHPLVAQLLESPHLCEQTILWRPAAVPELVVRTRDDVLVHVDETTSVVLDIKTDKHAPRPGSFARTCAQHHYYLQAAMYRDAAAAALPGREVHFVFVALAKTEPYEAACYDLDDDALALGRNQYEAAMVDLLRRRETGDWTADWQRSVHTLSLPRWATK